MLGSAPIEARDQQKDSCTLRHDNLERKAIVVQCGAFGVCSQSLTVSEESLIKCPKTLHWRLFPFQNLRTDLNVWRI